MNTIPVLHSDDIEEDRPLPSINHAIVCQNVGGQLYRFRDTVNVLQQLNLNLSGWQSIPDLCVYPVGVLPMDRLEDQDECTLPPTLVIEVLSPKQNIQPLLDKVREYHLHGVKTCWLVVPPTGNILILPHNGASRSVFEGVLKDEQLGIEVNVPDLFP